MFIDLQHSPSIWDHLGPNLSVPPLNDETMVHHLLPSYVVFQKFQYRHLDCHYNMSYLLLQMTSIGCNLSMGRFKKIISHFWKFSL